MRLWVIQYICVCLHWPGFKEVSGCNWIGLIFFFFSEMEVDDCVLCLVISSL